MHYFTDNQSLADHVAPKVPRSFHLEASTMLSPTSAQRKPAQNTAALECTADLDNQQVQSCMIMTTGP
jgi:hypothetical protein